MPQANEPRRRSRQFWLSFDLVAQSCISCADCLSGNTYKVRLGVRAVIAAQSLDRCGAGRITGRMAAEAVGDCEQ